MGSSGQWLPPAQCRDDDVLARFVRDGISVNAWPIHCPALRCLIDETGLDLTAGDRFSMTLLEMRGLMHGFYRRSRRVERMLGFDNAFHDTLHNFEVLLRLLVLEWPDGAPPPEVVRSVPARKYRSLEDVEPVLMEVLEALLGAGVPASVLARDLLAALGHDYGHSGGTDRLGADGEPTPLTHEETAERHAAKIGIEHGYPPDLILESMAAIRATTFYSRPSRTPVHPDNNFERKITLADVAGCALPADQWLTHVGLPVFKEKLAAWRSRLEELPLEIASVQERMEALDEHHDRRQALSLTLVELEEEDRRLIKDIEEWFRSERGFFLFIRDHRLASVAGADDLWGEVLKQRIALMEKVLERRDLLSPLVAFGFSFLERCTERLSNVEDLGAWLREEEVDPRLKEILAIFAPPADRLPSA